MPESEAEPRVMTDHCTLTIHRTESGYLFRIAGRGTNRESSAVRDFVCGAIEDGADVVLDLSTCEYLDSTFLGCLVLLHQRAAAHPGTFVVFADESTRERLLRQVGLDRLLCFVEALPPCTGEAVSLEVPTLERMEFCEHLLESHEKLAELGGPTAQTFASIAKQLAKELEDMR